MRSIPLAIALALALALPLPASAIVPASTDPTGLVLRQDADGATTLLLNVEDSPNGVVTVTKVSVAQTRPHMRETGVFLREYAGFGGAVTTSVGYYVASDTAMLRVPVVLLENVRASDPTADAYLSALNLAIQTGNNAVPFASELLVPELFSAFGGDPSASSFTNYRDRPTYYAWTAHRSGPAGDVWAGEYIARTGSTTLSPTGNVTSARADVEVGAATRVAGETTRGAGLYMESVYQSATTTTQGAQSHTITTGLASGGARTPIATVLLDDTRSGSALTSSPNDQTTRIVVGTQAEGEFRPLVGVETTQTIRPSQQGSEVTRITSAGVFDLDANYIPVAGMRYHSDTQTMVNSLVSLALDGPGSRDIGDFSIDVGAFPDGAYAPIAGLVHRDQFREARHAHVSLIGIGVYTPIGFSPLVVTTYDGSRPLVDWAIAQAAGSADGDEWMIATGTMAAGTYVALIGVEGVSRAPLQGRAEGLEVRVGVFAGSYRAFVPLASVAYDGDQVPQEHALDLVFGGGPGAEAGAFDVRVGTYAQGEYVGLVGAGLQSDWDGARRNETMVIAGAYGPDGFVPLVGVLYSGDDAFLGSLNNVANIEDDDTARVYAGVFVLGEWTPVLMIENSAEGVTVLPAPGAL